MQHQVERGGDPGQGGGADPGPGHRGRGGVGALQDDLGDLVPVGVGVDLADHEPARPHQVATALQQGRHVTADAQVAVHQQRRAPPALGRHRLADQATQRRDTAGPGGFDGPLRHVDAQRRATRAGQGLDHPAGTAAQIDHGRLAPGDHHLVHPVGFGRPAAHVQHQRRLLRACGGAGDPRRTRVHRVEQPVAALLGFGPHQCGPAAGEPQVGVAGGHRLRVLGQVDVPLRRQQPDLQSEVEQSGQLGRAGAVGGHRHPLEDPGRRAPTQPDRPVPAVLGQSEQGVGAAPVDLELAAVQLWGVHPHQQRPLGRPGPDRGEGGVQPVGQAALGLGDDLEAVGPAGRVAVEGQHPTADVGAADHVEGVAQRGCGQLGGFVGGEAGLQPGLRPPGTRFLGQHHHGVGTIAGRHRASTALMSRTALQAPSGVPVTLERPRRGR